MSAPSSPAGRSPRALIVTLALGAASAALYLLLYLFSDMLPELSATARRGETLYALVPLIVAMVFCFVHGAFTGQFCAFLGLRAKKK
jgi:hypothetical protein